MKIGDEFEVEIKSDLFSSEFVENWNGIRVRLIEIYSRFRINNQMIIFIPEKGVKFLEKKGYKVGSIVSIAEINLKPLKRKALSYHDFIKLDDSNV